MTTGQREWIFPKRKRDGVPSLFLFMIRLYDLSDIWGIRHTLNTRRQFMNSHASCGSSSTDHVAHELIPTSQTSSGQHIVDVGGCSSQQPRTPQHERIVLQRAPPTQRMHSRRKSRARRHDIKHKVQRLRLRVHAPWWSTRGRCPPRAPTFNTACYVRSPDIPRTSDANAQLLTQHPWPDHPRQGDQDTTPSRPNHHCRGNANGPQLT